MTAKGSLIIACSRGSTPSQMRIGLELQRWRGTGGGSELL